MNVMPQGFKAATRIAQDALEAIDRHAYKQSPPGTIYTSNYIDNHLRLCDKRNHQTCSDAFDDATKQVGADFGSERPAWDSTVAHIGSKMMKIGQQSCIDLKDAWKTQTRHDPSPTTINASKTYTHTNYNRSRDVGCDAHTLAAAVWNPQALEHGGEIQHGANPFTQILQAHLNTKGCHETAYVQHINLQHAMRINLTELLGILLCVVMAPTDCLLAVSTDNRSAKKWTKSGLAPTSFANRILQIITDAVSRKRIRLAIAWVESKRNVVDSFSRTDDRIGHMNLAWTEPNEAFSAVCWL